MEELEKLKSKLEQKKSILLKADFFLRYTLLHATSGDPNVMVRRIMRTSNFRFRRSHWPVNLASNVNSLCGVSETRTVSLLKQTMSPVEWNAQKSKDVIQQCYHWLELVSKYEAVSSEKISDILVLFKAQLGEAFLEILIFFLHFFIFPRNFDFFFIFFIFFSGKTGT